MKFRELSKAEWHLVRTMRGQKMTGYQAHRVLKKPIKGQPPCVVRGTGPTFYWPMGPQPDDTTIIKIMHKCPLMAAHLFLMQYERGTGLQINPPIHQDAA
jgi:hypothetical protein